MLQFAVNDDMMNITKRPNRLKNRFVYVYHRQNRRPYGNEVLGCHTVVCAGAS